MIKKGKRKNIILATFVASAIAVSPIGGGTVLAAEDKNETVIVVTDGGDVEIEAGDITTERGYGIHVISDDEYKATVTAGDIDSENDGIYIRANDESESTVTAGDIVSEDDGVNVEANDDSKVSVTVGDIKADGNGLDLEVNGESEVTITTGSITSSEEGLYLYMGEYDNDKSVLSLVTDGDVTSESTGLFFDTDSQNAKADVLVTGTISGKKAAIEFENDGLFYSDEDYPESESLSLTVWKIELNDDGTIANNTYDNSNNDPEAFEKRIMYIMRVEQPEGGAIELSDGDGKALSTSHDYEVANEGDKVFVKVTPNEGYILTGAYNGTDGEKLALLTDADGKYYVEVPKGGGVYLTAELEKEKYEISFYNEDGSVYSTQTVAYGDYITIPALPTRGGYKGLYWQGSVYYPGDKYQVTGPHTFKAIYEKIEEESSDKEKDASDASDTSTDTAAASVVNSVTRTTASPATGDNSMVVFMILLMILSSAGAASICACKCKINR